MLKSMTGFGKSECILSTKKITIEIKSLNSKQVDTSARLPLIYREKDLAIRQMISKSMLRGKIDCTIHYELIDGTATNINTEVVNSYLHQLKNISKDQSLTSGDLLATVMRLPDTVSVEKNDLDEEEWQIVKAAIEEALAKVNDFRIQEGEALEKDLLANINRIAELQKQVKPYAEERIDHIKERIISNLEELSLNEDIDGNRFEQELVYYAEKLDINEEQVRLKNHLDYFIQTLKEGSPNGKKLGFISQEIGREINTLGSKANHSSIQQIVVEMKEELEKIKEQVLNIL